MAERYDVVVVGAGNAAFCAALAAREHVERVLVLEKAPREHAGGNSFFSAGAFRVAYGSLAEIRPLLDDLSDEQAAQIDLPPYGEQQFLDDMRRLTYGRCDPALTAALVGNSLETLYWLRGLGVHWELLLARQSQRVGERIRFWGGLALGARDGGKGLMDAHRRAAGARGIELRYDCAVVGLRQSPDGRIGGVVTRGAAGTAEIEADAVVLACGGFEADPRLRAAYLGPNWDLAKVRGTPFNTGEGLRLALEAGAQPYGHWSGCHAVFWDAGAPLHGDWELTNRLSKLSYPIGIVVNAAGRRFLDEGADFRNYTYARYGAEVLHQPGAIAYQLFDAAMEPLLREDEYRAHGASRLEAESIEALATQLGLDPAALGRTVREFNAAVQPGEVDLSLKDGVGTRGIEPPKSNWARPLISPPFVAYAVTCGITFTFGGLRIDPHGRVLGHTERPIPGLYAAGELVGGLFYHNYPGGSGLTAGAVFGRRAGASAGQAARIQMGQVDGTA